MKRGETLGVFKEKHGDKPGHAAGTNIALTVSLEWMRPTPFVRSLYPSNRRRRGAEKIKEIQQ